MATPQELLIARIETARAEVGRLAGLVKHETVKSELGLATSEINEAAAALVRYDIEKRASMLLLVDMAFARLRTVREGVDKFGTDVKIIDGVFTPRPLRRPLGAP